jgi:hypothetical protein
MEIIPTKKLKYKSLRLMSNISNISINFGGDDM